MKRFKKALRCSAIASAMALLAIFPSASAGASATAVTYGKNVAAASSQAAHYATLKTAQAGGVAKALVTAEVPPLAQPQTLANLQLTGSL